jgi:hypothetical protein
MVEERVTLLERMRKRVEEHGGLPHSVASLDRQATATRRRADVLRGVLTEQGVAAGPTSTLTEC